jgi:hypothetical protein
MITQSTYAPTNHERVAEYLHKTALRGTYTRSPRPYPSRSLSSANPLSGVGQAALNDDYRPEMADCRGW